MKQIRNLGDSRNKGWCAHCGGPYESEDHNPSKIFLDAPLPPNVPVVPSCRGCNSGFSLDEEYLACLLECVVTGSADPATFERISIAKSLLNNAKLARELAAARTEADGRIVWSPDHGRVAKVVTKLARGHAAFEQNEPQLNEPDDLRFGPLALMEEMERRRFEGEQGEIDLWPDPEAEARCCRSPAKNCSGVPSKRPQSSGLWPRAVFAGAPASRSSEGMLSIARGRPVSEGDLGRSLRRGLV